MKKQEQQNSKITQIIRLGKEQGYLTYPQIKSLLPHDDEELLEALLDMFKSMDIRVFEAPPHEEELASLENSQIQDDDDLEDIKLIDLDTERPRLSHPISMGDGNLMIDIISHESNNMIEMNSIFSTPSGGNTENHLLKNFKKIKPEEIQLLKTTELLKLEKLDKNLYEDYLKEQEESNIINNEKCPITLTSLKESFDEDNDNKFVLVELLENHNNFQKNQKHNFKKNTFLYDYDALESWLKDKRILPDTRTKIEPENCIIKEIHYTDTLTTDYEPFANEEKTSKSNSFFLNENAKKPEEEKANINFSNKI